MVYLIQEMCILLLKKTHNFWTNFGDSDCSGAGSEPCQGSKRFEAGTVHYCSFPSVRNTKLPDEPGKSVTLIPSRCAGICSNTRICPNHVLAGTLRVIIYHCYGQNNKNNSLQNPLKIHESQEFSNNPQKSTYLNFFGTNSKPRICKVR